MQEINTPKLNHFDWDQLMIELSPCLLPLDTTHNLKLINKALCHTSIQFKQSDIASNNFLYAMITCQWGWFNRLLAKLEVIEKLQRIPETRWIQLYEEIKERLLIILQPLEMDGISLIWYNIRIILEELGITWKPNVLTRIRDYNDVIEAVPYFEKICFSKFD